MNFKILTFYSLILLTASLSCRRDNSLNDTGMIQLISVKVGSSVLNINGTTNVPNDQPVQLTFTSPIDTSSITKTITLKNYLGAIVPCSYSATNNLTLLTLTPTSILQYSKDYTLTISSALNGIHGETFPGVQFTFKTAAGTLMVNKFPINWTVMTTYPLQYIDPK